MAEQITHYDNHHDFLTNYMQEVVDITQKIDKQEIAKGIDILFDAWKNGNHVFLMGCGGSAATASHFAGDLSKTTASPGKPKFKSISLVDNAACVSAYTNDEGWHSVFKGQIENFIKPGDVAIGFSVHGGKGKANAGTWSQNMTIAMEYVKAQGGKNIGIAGFDGGAFKELCDACIIVPKDSTPLVEGFHCDIQHMMIFRLKELIEKHKHTDG